jgi:hypothetical protein
MPASRGKALERTLLIDLSHSVGEVAGNPANNGLRKLGINQLVSQPVMPDRVEGLLHVDKNGNCSPR